MRNRPSQAIASSSAWELQKEFAIEHPAQVELDRLAMALNLLVLRDGLKGAEARLCGNGKFGVVRLNEEIREIGRERFAIAHEMGHWRLHPNLSQLMVCQEPDLRDYKSSAPEIEANIFASEFLMPTRLFSKRCESLDLGLTSVETLAEEFVVSLTAAAVRFVDMSNEECMVVFSEEREVKWWRASSGCPRSIWIESRQSLSRDSDAWDFCERAGRSERMHEVPFAAWYPKTDDLPNRAKVREESIRLGNYPTVMTLLWLSGLE